jgi:hypothetical protein
LRKAEAKITSKLLESNSELFAEIAEFPNTTRLFSVKIQTPEVKFSGYLCAADLRKELLINRGEISQLLYDTSIFKTLFF